MSAVTVVAVVVWAAVGHSWSSSAPGPHGANPPAASAAQHRASAAAYGQLPLAFEPNHGQFDHRVKFAARGAGYSLYLTRSSAVLSLAAGTSRGAASAHRALPSRFGVLRIGLAGASRRATLAGAGRLAGTVNYFTGRQGSGGWHTRIPTYSAVRYRDVWPGIGVKFYGRGGRFEYDFDVAAGADPDQIGLSLKGARRVSAQPSGALLVHLAGGSVRQLAPRAYQQVGGARRTVAARYVLGPGGRVRVRLGAYDHRRPLVIDPALIYSTYLGGNNGDPGYGIAVDSDHNAYVTGYSTSTSGFPFKNAFKTTTQGADVFVTKLDSAGQLDYSTFLGADDDAGYAIAVDSDHSAYVTGEVDTTGFPVTAGALQPTFAGGNSDAFLAKLSPDGSRLVYSTYLGGAGAGDAGTDVAQGIAVDSDHNAYITGITASTSFPTQNASQGTKGGGNSDAFVTKINPAASGAAQLVYSTYLGGSGNDFGYAIAVDSDQNAYVTGTTFSTNFPTLTPLQSARSGSYDAFVTKLNPAGQRVYSTYLGGSSGEDGEAIAVDSAGSAYITGDTGSPNFPTQDPMQPSKAGASGIAEAFVTKLNPAGTQLVYSTFLGGTTGDYGYGIAVDSADNAYVTGATNSTDFPVQDAIQATYAGGAYDAFVTKLSAAGQLVYSTYLGGTGDDTGRGVAVDAAHHAYIVGQTGSTNFPTAAAQQGSNAGGIDTFVTKLGQPIVLSKRASVGEVRPGGSVTYTLETHNPDDGTISDAMVTDDLSNVLNSASLEGTPTADKGTVGVSGDQLTWHGDLGPDATATITYTVRVHEGLTGGLLVNSATALMGLCGTGNPVEPCTTETEIVPEPPAPPSGPPPPGAVDLRLIKTASPDHARPGGEVTYQLLVRNHGDTEATGVVLEDPIPSGVSVSHRAPSQGHCTVSHRVLRCELGAIRGGGEALVQVTAIVQTDASGTITNRATVFADQDRVDPSRATDSSAVRITPHASRQPDALPPPPPPPPPPTPVPPLHPATPQQAGPLSDLVVTNHASHAQVRRGRRIAYTITVTNRGPDAADRVLLKHAFRLPFRIFSVHAGQGSCSTRRPIICNLGRLPVGGHVTVRIVTGADIAANQLLFAGAASASRDPHPATAVAQAATRVIPVLDLRLHPSRRILAAGDTTVLHVHVTNVNGVTLHHLRTCLTLPAGLAYEASQPRSTAAPHGQRCWTRASLANNHSAAYTVTARGLAAATGATGAVAGDPTVHATATATGADTAHARTSVTITPRPAVTG